MAVKFGVFVPQGWKMDLVGIPEPVEQYEAMTRAARAADEAGFDSIWVYDHFHTVPEPTLETTFEAWTITAGLVRDTQARARGPDGDLQRLPQPGAAGEDGLDGGRDEPRAADLRAGRGLVRARVAGLRLRLPRSAGAHGHVPRGVRDRPRDVDRGKAHLPGQILHHRRADQRAEGRAQAAPRPLARRRRREGDAQAGRQVGRRLQRRRRQPRDDPAQGGGAAPAL